MARTIGIVLPTSLPISTSYLKDKIIKIKYNGIKIPTKLPMSIGGITQGNSISKTTSPIMISIKEKAEQ